MFPDRVCGAFESGADRIDIDGLGQVDHRERRGVLAVNCEWHGHARETGDDLVVAGLVGHRGGLSRQLPGDGPPGRPLVNWMSVTRSLGHDSVGMPRFDTGERHRVSCIALEGGDERRHAEFAGDGGELRKRRGLEVARHIASKAREARTEFELAPGVSHHQSVVLERAHDAVGDRAVQLESMGQFVDGQRLLGVGQDLKGRQPAGQGL